MLSFVRICSVWAKANSLATTESAVSGVVYRRCVAIYVFLPLSYAYKHL